VNRKDFDVAADMARERLGARMLRAAPESGTMVVVVTAGAPLTLKSVGGWRVRIMQEGS
jgi:hypothetical protein